MRPSSWNRKQFPLSIRLTLNFALSLVFLCAALVTWASQAKPGEATPKALVKVKAGVVLPSSPTGWLYTIAHRKGFFREEGLEVQAVVTYEQIAALIGGSVDIAEYDPASTLIAHAKGAEILIAATLYDKAPFFILSRPDIRGIKELSGKQFAVSGVPSGDWALAQFFFQKHETDVVYRNIGGSPQRLAALQAGQVQATILVVPFHQKAIDAGMKALVTPDDLVYPWLDVFVRKSWVKENGPTLVRYLRGLHKATKWIEDPKNRDEMIKLVIELAKVDAETARISYDGVIAKKLNRVKPLTLEDAKVLVASLEKEKAVPRGYDPRGAIENRYVEEALKGK